MDFDAFSAYLSSMYLYVTFSEEAGHRHEVDGIVFDHTRAAVIECAGFLDGRRKTFELFGREFETTLLDSEVYRERPGLKFDYIIPNGRGGPR